MAQDESAAAAPKRRALPFKRTVARKQRAVTDVKEAEEDNDLDLFRHSKEVFPEILREAEEAEEEQQHDRKRRKTSTSPSTGADSSRKQSRALDDSDDDLIIDVKGKGKEIIPARRPFTPIKPGAARPRTPGTAPITPASHRAASRNPVGSPEDPVTIADSDSDADPSPIASPSQTKKPTKPLTLPQSGSSSPVEILPADPFQSPSKPTTTSATTQTPAAEDDDDEFSEWVAKARAIQAAQSQDAVVQAIISSPLAGGANKPLMARLRLNQGVQLLLRVWVASNRAAGVPIPDDVAERLFLTWKGNKIYGHSTLASLGVMVDAQGKLKGASRGGEGYSRHGIHLEVWSEEAYAEFLAIRGRERAMLLGEDGEDGPDGDVRREETAPPSPVQPKKKGVRIMLKAKDHEPLKLTAREETDVKVLIEAFRVQRSIGPECEVAIWFDGERLDEDALVTEIDVDPDEVNQLEVHVKKVGH
ncbi:hypothetical protein N658DRAFT_496988 [Parathielavia hyrcaniae]|uniref:Rad60/SUMO-like domain-containing protein n=1 Tax=Parathielavia hyrcaniae TaxID=113614 RepID=A0AAN6T1T0_9PEZI|nr:hypothetical protein N658DRAFT_496988 [Parathielavia hyrcaniae]